MAIQAASFNDLQSSGRVSSSCAATAGGKMVDQMISPGHGSSPRTTVKYNWGLTLQSSEKSALQSMLNTCAA